ncbi:FAD-linked sulfhydryl oxidase [Bandra megavirus]|uniref:Sulfhydryl oxidase n=1 Tax=Bandra megavirus TaxID=2071566 RepID=A0A2K9V8X0_9VIRU|nr:FAD-linked sulfhydryl oxidase [Bandra megavirus]
MIIHLNYKIILLSHNLLSEIMHIISKHGMDHNNNLDYDKHNDDHHDHDDHKNNGLITKIWGSAGWTFCHSVTFGYPINPTEKDKINYKNFFISLGDVLPCRYCRESYQKFITEGDTALTLEVLDNRESLTKWFYRIHNAVNKKLEIDYGVTYQDVVDRYESFRAKCGKSTDKTKGCVAPLDYKAFSFKKLYYSDAPIIPINIANKFIYLAKQMGLDKNYFIFMNLVQELDGDIIKLKTLSSWTYRNQYCQKQIRYMRENAIPSIDEYGIPTIDEIKLILCLCSNLNKSELYEAINHIHNF